MRHLFQVVAIFLTFDDSDKSRVDSPHRSTTDHIATLRMILQTRREHCKPSGVACVNFRAAFNSAAGVEGHTPKTY